MATARVSAVRRPGSSGNTMQVLSPEARPSYVVEDVEWSPVGEELEVSDRAPHEGVLILWWGWQCNATPGLARTKEIATPIRMIDTWVQL